MHFEHMDVVKEGEIAWVTLNRPERLNALSLVLMRELFTFFTALYDDPSVRVVVLRGAGRAFCAGLDLKDQQRRDISKSVAVAMGQQRTVRDIMLAMRRCPQPIIAMLHGAASGGGMALGLASDVRLATPDLRMNASFIRVGLSGCDVGVSYFLPRMVGSSVAAELLLTGRFLDARRGAALGLFSNVVELPQLEAEARALATDMLAATPLGLRLTKEALGHAIDAGSLEAVIALEDRNQVLCTQGEDFEEGIAAFLEKRPPRYGAGAAD
jgi:enoyl-CoA hydratase